MSGTEEAVARALAAGPRRPMTRKSWRKLREQHAPRDTCGASRHVQIIAEALRDRKSGEFKALEAAGFDPEHWASSLEGVVIALWSARARLPDWIGNLPTATSTPMEG